MQPRHRRWMVCMVRISRTRNRTRTVSGGVLLHLQESKPDPDERRTSSTTGLGPTEPQRRRVKSSGSRSKPGSLQAEVVSGNQRDQYEAQLGTGSVCVGTSRQNNSRKRTHILGPRNRGCVAEIRHTLPEQNQNRVQNRSSTTHFLN